MGTRYGFTSRMRLGIAGGVGGVAGASIVIYSLATDGPPPMAAVYGGVVALALLGIFIAWPSREGIEVRTNPRGAAQVAVEEQGIIIRWSGVAVVTGAVGFVIASWALTDRDGGALAWIGLALMAGSFVIGLTLFIRAGIRAIRRVVRRHDRVD